MIVPSYEDLTPGIPDVVDATRAEQLALLIDQRTPNAQLPPTTHGNRIRPGPRDPGALGSWESGVRSLYACLRQQTANPDRDALLTVAADFSPRVMRATGTEILVDVSGLGRLIGEPPAVQRELTRAVREAGVAAVAAIGATQTVARLRAACGDPEAAIETLPVASLQPLETLPPGMAGRDRARPYEIFDKWGIATLADLAALPSDALASRLGRRGLVLQRLARGGDVRPFVPEADIPRYVERLALEWPIEALEPLSFVLPRLLDPLAAALERADRGAAAIRLELRLTDRSTHVSMLQLPAPIRDARVLRTLLLLDLESAASALRGFGATTAAVTAGIDVVTVEIDPAPARITQFSLLTRALPSPETLSTLTARLSALVGGSRVGSPALLDSHRPDAWVMERYAPEGANGERGATGAGARGAIGAEGAVLRRRRPPVAIRVSVAGGRPVHIAGSRRGVPCGVITQAAGPWRSSGEWWTDNRWNRIEWDVALTSGTVCRIYQDRTTERWFLEGTYD